MEPQPLSKAIYNKAKELGVTKITLAFSGGSDEGYLDITYEPYNKSDTMFTSQIENWAWEVYSYSGAGDGSDYGDNIIYDLENNKVSTNEWYQVVEEGEYENSELTVEDKSKNQ